MDLDPETLRLLVQLQLEDLNDLDEADTCGGKGKGRDDSNTAASFDAAIELCRADLVEYAQILADNAMCISMSRAVETDASTVTAAAQDEDRALQDRLLAMALSRGENITTLPFRPVPPGATTAVSDADTTVSDTTTAVPDRTTGIPDAETLPEPESSSWAASRWPPSLHQFMQKWSWQPPTSATKPEKKKKAACVACGDGYSARDILSCPPPCNHGYCRDCLEGLFRAAMTDETLFPPRCCGQPITLHTVQGFLPESLVREFSAKKLEFETPNRTYCFQPTCSAFIPPQDIGQTVGVCSECFHCTCTVCKGAAHPGSVECPDDPAAQEMVELAGQMGWQKCKPCGRFIELDTGCNHMTCPCGAQFCYVCGETWKRCSCPQWQEERLFNRANAIVDRNHGEGQLRVGQRAALVERERNLIQNHQCQHGSWAYRSGSHRCEECHCRLPSFIFECEQCQILACRRCRYNRLA
ncbi:hypothetical protein QBC44DRAFT_19021 [Cladorrhinum sp. PSN332]|nr:hypothetical protein QBC44DRAFT_19021 [Cladorrhinum sp. PSN332]